ncbi:MAG TPA: sulfotransferase domain-containing protein [Mycobacteriales bacterium]|nr:sulfotransferase domain-containing protein [Mycobacteriales bacterium]
MAAGMAVTMPGTGRRLLLPDFVVIGGPKCGTHWLNECLREHPEIDVTPDVHEIFFFDRYFDRGLEWYAHYFRGCTGDHYFRGCTGDHPIGDVTPTYLANPLAAQRLADVLPAATLLVCLRNPVERAWSHYLHLWRKGDLPRDCDFRTACELAPQILTDGEFFRCLQPWLARFPAEQLHFLVLDDAKRDSAAYLRRVYEILGVSRDFIGPHTATRTNQHQSPRSLGLARVAFRVSRWLHARGWHGGVELGKRLGLRRMVLQDGHDPDRDPAPPKAADRTWLADHFRDDVTHLSELLGRDLVRLWLADAPSLPPRAAGGGQLQRR